MEPNLSQALHLINGQSVHDKIQQGGLVARMLHEGKSAAEVVDHLYLHALSRRPTEEERKSIDELIAQHENPQSTVEDLFWALLNSREFIFNH
jgi:hypothetical protein